MTVLRSIDDLHSLLHELRKLPVETEWLEFKQNKAEPDAIGEYVSALANSAALEGKVAAWLIWGVENDTRAVVGTTFDPAMAKVGNEELESWLLRLLEPKIDFRFHAFKIDDCSVVILEVSAASRHPVRFKGTEFVRVGSYKKKLKDFPNKERELWRTFDRIPFERQVAAESVDSDTVLKLLDYPSYFDLLNLPLPESKSGLLEALAADAIIVRNPTGRWDITNFGAVLFARKLSEFQNLARKAVRVIHYRDSSRVETIREQTGGRGYATGFENLVKYISDIQPHNEVMGQALRKDVSMFPELAIRELVANALIHQDFDIRGTGPCIELFDNRLEVTNPGLPLVRVERFLNGPPKSRNELLASFMRRIGVCEERGSGVDKVVFQTELFQLPAPLFESTEEHTVSVLFAHKSLNDMDQVDRVRACYLHACLRYAQRDFMTNASLRERFGIESRNSAKASRLIGEALDQGLIAPHDPDAGKKFMKYVPYWAASGT